MSLFSVVYQKEIYHMKNYLIVICAVLWWLPLGGAAIGVMAGNIPLCCIMVMTALMMLYIANLPLEW